MSGMSTTDPTGHELPDDWAEKYDYPMVFGLGAVAIGHATPGSLGSIIIDREAFWVVSPDGHVGKPFPFLANMDDIANPKTSRVETVGTFVFDTSHEHVAISDRPMRHGHPEDVPEGAHDVVRPEQKLVGYATYRVPIHLVDNKQIIADNFDCGDFTPVSYEFKDPEVQDRFVAEVAGDDHFFDGSMVDPGEEKDE